LDKLKVKYKRGQQTIYEVSSDGFKTSDSLVYPVLLVQDKTSDEQ